MSDTVVDGVRRLNPWLSMWTKPRRTMRQILDDDPFRHVILITALTGVGSAITSAADRALGDIFPWPAVIVMCFIGGPIGAFVSLYVWSLLLHWTGRWLAGAADQEDVLAAIAWSNLPLALAALLAILQIPVFGEELFSSDMPRVDQSIGLQLSAVAFALIRLVLSLWTVVLLVRAVAEAQKFGAWKGLANVAIAGAILLVAVLPFVLLMRLAAR